MEEQMGFAGGPGSLRTNNFKTWMIGGAIAVCVFGAITAVVLTTAQGKPGGPDTGKHDSKNVVADSLLPKNFADDVAKIITSALDPDFSLAHDRLRELCDTFGPRLSGSTNLELAIDWAYQTMLGDGLDNVHTENTTVPVWVRGEEYAYMESPSLLVHHMNMAGLGGSIATPPEGINATCVVVSSFEELEERQDEVPGKFVVYNVPFTTYGGTVMYRTEGAKYAAKYGAVASLTRSITPFSLQTPHTGGMYYDLDVAPAIPAAAITLEDAELIARLTENGEEVRVFLFMSASGSSLPDAPSANVIGQITGSEFPDEYVVIGGHIDSWDLASGAQDDGGGIISCWEAVRTIYALGLRPRRTLRVVLFTNEENGGKGGYQYYTNHVDEMDKTSLAIENDIGTFQPLGIGFSGTPEARDILSGIGSYLKKDVGSEVVSEGGGGSDISLMMNAGVPGAGLQVGGNYFWYHHTPADTFNAVDAKDLRKCTATMAVYAYGAAQLDTLLPRE